MGIKLIWASRSSLGLSVSIPEKAGVHINGTDSDGSDFYKRDITTDVVQSRNVWQKMRAYLSNKRVNSGVLDLKLRWEATYPKIRILGQISSSTSLLFFSTLLAKTTGVKKNCHMKLLKNCCSETTLNFGFQHSWIKVTHSTWVEEF